jgi:hypothetical protein
MGCSAIPVLADLSSLGDDRGGKEHHREPPQAGDEAVNDSPPQIAQEAASLTALSSPSMGVAPSMTACQLAAIAWIEA